MGGRNPTCKMFALVCMATKAAVPPTAAVSNETADAANAGMPKAHQPKQMHKQACEEPPAHNRTQEAHAHINAAQGPTSVFFLCTWQGPPKWQFPCLYSSVVEFRYPWGQSSLS